MTIDVDMKNLMSDTNTIVSCNMRYCDDLIFCSKSFKAWLQFGYFHAQIRQKSLQLSSKHIEVLPSFRMYSDVSCIK